MTFTQKLVTLDGAYHIGNQGPQYRTIRCLVKNSFTTSPPTPQIRENRNGFQLPTSARRAVSYHIRRGRLKFDPFRLGVYRYVLIVGSYLSGLFHRMLTSSPLDDRYSYAPDIGS